MQQVTLTSGRPVCNKVQQQNLFHLFHIPYGACLCLLWKRLQQKYLPYATISSWIKQTVLLCHYLSYQEALTLYQVKPPDFRDFAASKVFQPGVSSEQLLSACDWKSHKTFTEFCLNVAWADSELFHLGQYWLASRSAATLIFN